MRKYICYGIRLSETWIKSANAIFAFHQECPAQLQMIIAKRMFSFANIQQHILSSGIFCLITTWSGKKEKIVVWVNKYVAYVTLVMNICNLSYITNVT